MEPLHSSLRPRGGDSDDRTPRRQRVAYEETLVDWRAAELSMAALRAAFLALMDRAMRVVEGAGWSPDDVVCDRRLHCVAASGARWECEAASLIDADRLRGMISDAARDAGAVGADTEQTRVVALVCSCHAEGWPERDDARTRHG